MYNKKINNIDESDSFKYRNDTDFIKKLHSLRAYCPRAYKDLIFNINLQDLINSGDGVHKKKLFTSELFRLVYGQIELIYSVKNGKIIIENLMPQDFLLDGHINLLDVYKGMPFRNKKDKFKIDLSLAIIMRKELEV